MKYEIDLIKRKAKIIKDKNVDQKTEILLTDIIKLSNACLSEIDAIDVYLTSICLGMRRVTTDIK